MSTFSLFRGLSTVSYDPDETLIMNYVPPSCMERFTPGQGARMRYVISESFPDGVLASVLVNTVSQNPVVSVTQTWNASSYPGGIARIQGNLTVKSGAILTIGAGLRVEFATTGKLIIEPNARVNLNGTLSSWGCGQTWKGVEVQGTCNNINL